MDKWQSGIRFAKRMYYPRIAGTLLCSPIIFVSIVQFDQPKILIFALALNVLMWPHLAYRIARQAKDPYKTEILNLSFDSLFCGLWISSIGLNSFGSISMSAMVILNTIATGGVRFMRRGLLLQALGVFLYGIVFDISLQESPASSAWASLPLLAIYPMIVGFASYQLASELQKTKFTLKSLSVTDDLTGLLNRRYVNQALSDFAEESSRCMNSLLILMDIDNFKKINDSYGHDVGDKALCLLSETLKSSLRPDDVLARFGGDEFCIIMWDTSQDQAVKIISRIQCAFKRNSFDAFNESLSISAGISSWDSTLESASQWFIRADQLLYKAKINGRDRAEVN